MGFLNIQNSYEKKAQAYLTRQGAKFIYRNYYCCLGEIDLIMLDKQQKLLIIIEVKYRQSSDYGSAEESVTKAKQKKIILTTEHFLNSHSQYRDLAVRFDVVAINQDSINWIQSAFE